VILKIWRIFPKNFSKLVILILEKFQNSKISQISWSLKRQNSSQKNPLKVTYQSQNVGPCVISVERNCLKWAFLGWSELAATNAPVEDEPVQPVLG
jgi:hypothetical protein